MAHGNQLGVSPAFDESDEDGKQHVKKDLEPKDGEYVRLVKLTSSMFSSLLSPETSLKESETEQQPNVINNGLVSVTETDDKLVYNDEHKLVAGSLEALLRHLVPTQDYYPERTYLFTFLLCSRLFIRPYELLQRVHHLTVMIKPSSQDSYTSDHLSHICPKMVQLLSDWAEMFPYDFRDEDMMRHLKTVTQRCTQLDNRLRKDVTMLMQKLLHKLSKLDKYEDLHDGHSGAPINAVISPLPAVDIAEVCPNPVFLAQQLAHIELEKLSQIGPEEFVQAFAVENSVTTKHCVLKRTRNLESYVQWFNRTSNLVATEICRHPKKKTRVKLIEYLIEVARECFNQGNFNSMMAIVAGLNQTPVSRLKKTWAKVNTAKFDILEHQIDPTSNFASYRSTLKAAKWRSQGTVDGSEKIIIPCFSLLLKDLYFLNEGCANKLPNGNINFEKFWQLSKQVSEFMSWQTVICPFEKLPKVIQYLTSTSVFSESALALASFDCESPDNHIEKERYKSLKCELLLVH